MKAQPRTEFCAALIAGGKSSRMGCDKRLIEIGGKPLWRRQVEILQSLEPAELVISGPPDGPWSEAGFRVIPDCRAGYGPLGGIASVLASVSAPWVLALAVDMPEMSGDFLRQLLCKCSNEVGVVPCTKNSFEPLAAVFPRECGRISEEQLHSGEYSLQAFVRKCYEARLVTRIDVQKKDAHLFRNLNEPADVECDG